VQWSFKWGNRERTPSPSPEVSQDGIKARAFLLSKVAPWRTAEENWELANRELTKPWPFAFLVSLWRWTGISEKKGWDLFAGISLPVILTAGGWYITTQDNTRQQKMADEVQKNSVLEAYVESIKSLLLDKEHPLGASNPSTVSQGIARAVTLAALTQLDDKQDSIQNQVGSNARKSLAINFLLDSGLNTRPAKIFSLSGANLSRASISGVDLSGVDLSGADLSRADLRGVFLSGADLRGADFSGADLSGADLSGAFLSGAKFKDTICPDGKTTDTGC
jgi:hypothetical protein